MKKKLLFCLTIIYSIFSVSAQSLHPLHGTWYEDTLHERSAIKRFVYTIDMNSPVPRLIIDDKKDRTQKSYKIILQAGNNISFDPLSSRSSSDLEANRSLNLNFPDEIEILDNDHFKIHFRYTKKPMSFVKEAYIQKKNEERMQNALEFVGEVIMDVVEDIIFEDPYASDPYNNPPPAPKTITPKKK